MKAITQFFDVEAPYGAEPVLTIKQKIKCHLNALVNLSLRTNKGKVKVIGCIIYDFKTIIGGDNLVYYNYYIIIPDNDVYPESSLPHIHDYYYQSDLYNFIISNTKIKPIPTKQRKLKSAV